MFFKVESYQLRALPFGLSSAPWLFTLVAREFTSLIHSQNTAQHQFLDDWLGRVMYRDRCAKHRDLVLLLCKELGWVVNLEKSELVPQQVFAFVGIHYDLISFTAHPTLKNWIKVIRAAESLVQANPLPAVAWQSIIGILQGQSHLVPFGCPMSALFSGTSLGSGTSSGILRTQRSLFLKTRGLQPGGGWTKTPR